jgi:hypothetical protein
MNSVAVVSTASEVERLRCSSSGNPRWRIITSRGVFVTSPNSMCAYDVENYFRSARAPRFAMLSLNKRGQVVGISPVGDDA